MSRAALLLAAASLAASTAAGAPGSDPDAAVLASIPFVETGEPNRIYLDMAPEGHKRPLRILLDTGASYSVFSPLAAREAGVRVRRMKRTDYRRKTRLGADLQFQVDTSSSDTGTRMGWEYGLLGGNFLEEYVVEIDFPSRAVRFLDPRRYAVPESGGEGAFVVPLRVSGRRPYVEIQVDGESAWALLDTGAPFPAIVSGGVADRAGLEPLPSVGIRSSMILGPLPLKLAEAELRLGPSVARDQPVLVAERGLYNWSGSDNCLVGYDVFADAVVRLDYRRGRMWVRPTAEPRSTLLGGDWPLFRESGALVVPYGGGWVVHLLRPESPAAELGLLPGDRFAAEMQPDDLRAALAGRSELRLLRTSNQGDVEVAVRAPVAVP